MGFFRQQIFIIQNTVHSSLYDMKFYASASFFFSFYENCIFVYEIEISKIHNISSMHIFLISLMSHAQLASLFILSGSAIPFLSLT